MYLCNVKNVSWLYFHKRYIYIYNSIDGFKKKHFKTGPQIYSYIFSFSEIPQTGKYVKREHRFVALKTKNEGIGCEVAKVSVDFSTILVVFL